ncbi:hypothetical protein BT93_L5468 [Corymbia citriodora subsp. variegata]|uniref:Uncharacterized protein n=1 Tax=Corymbia citriodora subsp. variegata TaxID=360336 RepID=A0A8T0CWQ5_CORYI|nr:hypothetical protein BT93_L5468 [Corymbia citriodora subsp. variegata]KAF7850456.1 hypothetical protein BT93_L5468 [Corymbia citriodora subsp. variegata]
MTKFWIIKRHACPFLTILHGSNPAIRSFKSVLSQAKRSKIEWTQHRYERLHTIDKKRPKEL